MTVTSTKTYVVFSGTEVREYKVFAIVITSDGILQLFKDGETLLIAFAKGSWDRCVLKEVAQ